MMKFIHLTDPHFVQPNRLLYGLDPEERLRRAVQDINRHHGDAAFVAITGDLTHWGETTAYDLLEDVLAELVIPCHLALGNHDHRARFCNVFPDTPRDPNGFVQYAVENPIGTFLFLDTTDPGRSDGRLCPKRLGWLTEALADRPGPFYLLMHHPPFDCGIEIMDSIRLQNAEAFWSVVEPHRDAVRHLFFGHLHRPLSGSWRGIPMSTLWGTNHQVELVLTPAEGLTGTLGQPAYAVVLVNEETVLVHTHPYLDPSLRVDYDDDTVRDTTESLDPWA